MTTEEFELQVMENALSQHGQFAARASAQSAPQASAKIAGVPIGPRMALVPPTSGLDPGHTGLDVPGAGQHRGRIRSIVVDPRDSSRLWAGSVGVGFGIPATGESRQAAANDFLADLAVSCMAIDRSHPDTVYAGTGEGFFNLDAIRAPAFSGPRRQRVGTKSRRPIRRISRRLIGLPFPPTGRSCSRRPRAAFSAAATRAELHGTEPYRKRSPSSRAIRWMARGRWPRACATVKRTIQPTAGKHGRSHKAGLGPDELNLLMRRMIRPRYVTGSCDGGADRRCCMLQSFTRRRSVGTDQNPTNYLGDQGWYGNSIWAGDPKDANLVLVGGINLWRSTDGGDTLIDISTWWEDRSCHADHHCIVADPKYDGVANSTVYFGNDGGIYKAQNARTVGDDPQPPRIAGWIKLDNSFGVTQFYSGAGNPATGMIIGGAQDNGTLTYRPQSGS